MFDSDMIKEMLCSFLNRGLVGLPAKVRFTYRENTTNCNRVFFFLSPSVVFFFFGSLILFLILLFLGLNFVVYFVCLG
jgi:hypothetical protein